MYFLRSIAAVIVSAYAFTTSNAHSTERNPLTYLTVVENANVNTPSHRIHALSSFDLTFDLHDGEQRIKLKLAPNHDVIAEGATISYLAADGSLRTSEALDRSEYRVFKGQTLLQHQPGAEWTNVGWARIMVQQDGENPIFEGAFRVDGDHHHVQTRTHYMQTRHALDPELEASDSEYMVVWRDSDVGDGFTEDNEGMLHAELRRSVDGQPSCSSDGLSFNTQPDHPVYAAMMKREDSFWGSVSTRRLFGRQIDGQTGGNSAGVNLTSTIGSTAGCPSTRKVALVGVATDCTYTAVFNSTASARANIISILNSASVQYEDSFNITLGLLNLTVSDATCPATASSAAPWNVGCSDNITIQDRLNLFSGWRGQFQDNNAYWTLLSTCATQSAVGLAWLGQACVTTSQVASSSTGNETVSGANVVVRTSTEWQVLAHETGHTFGAVHDCDSTTCADGTTVASQQCCPLSSSTCDAGGVYIMNPSTGPNIQKFSPCTVGNICSAIGRNSVKTTCLTANKDVTTITGSQCGNGIVETGEECDCGGLTGCAGNICCDATTCKFTTNSVCDPSNEDCCTSTCQFAGNGTVCRTSTGICDPQEVCNGSTATCPPDATAPDGTSCGNSSSLYCASGQCTSRDLQCKTLMGSYTEGNDTYACSSAGCQISCASPEFGTNVCYSMQQNFLDGTSCQGGGRCSNGQCKGSSVGKEITSWIHSNKTLVIALASVIGGLLILGILSCCWSRYRRRQNLKKRQNLPPPPGWVGGGNWIPPQQTQNMRAVNGGMSPGWEDGRWKQPPPPAWTPGPSVSLGRLCYPNAAILTVPLQINGKDVFTDKTFDVVNPTGGKVIHNSAAASLKEVELAVEAAQKAFLAWAATPPNVKRNIFLKAADILESKTEEVGKWEEEEAGATTFYASGFDVPTAVNGLRDIAGRISTVVGMVPQLQDPGTSAMVLKEPYGVIVGIAPWNATFILGFRACTYALAAGNTVVFKASEVSPRSLGVVGTVFREAGLPDGVLNVIQHVPEDAAAVTKALIEHPAVKKINFTGSTAVGRIIAELAGKNLKPVLLELGGKAPAIVLDDADIPSAARACAMGAFLHSGQICMSTERLLVEKGISGKFADELKVAIEEMFPSSGPALVLMSNVGVKKNKSLLADAESKGASVIFGNPKAEEKQEGYMRPVVVKGVKKGMDLYYTESFGPTVSFFEVEDEEEAIRIANDTEYGLSSAVFTKDLARGLRLAKRIESGAVHINAMSVHDEPGLPHGGVKSSGFGRFGAPGIEEWVKTKTITYKN